MQFAVSDREAPHYWSSVLFGCLLLFVADLLWFCGVYQCVYAAHIPSPRRLWVRIAAVVCYGVVGSFFAATFNASTASDAASAGALLGMVIFLTFNVTMYGISSDYGGGVALLDTLYGTTVWAALLVVQHHSPQIAAAFLYLFN